MLWTDRTSGIGAHGMGLAGMQMVKHNQMMGNNSSLGLLGLSTARLQTLDSGPHQRLLHLPSYVRVADQCTALGLSFLPSSRSSTGCRELTRNTEDVMILAHYDATNNVRGASKTAYTAPLPILADLRTGNQPP